MLSAHREDWKPVLTINSIIYGLQYLFLVSRVRHLKLRVCWPSASLLPVDFHLYRPQEPNPEDPLNKEAAEVLQNNRRLFEQNVQRSMRGGYIGSTYFERCLK
jgi:ubiquitin-conjugating enzyme E2 M|uniref:Ube2m protein n=1 Tax=Mus musculus TaxID=10090 RepID=Q8R352_MOUSE|nr:Ube2m protein [Mus musculus]